MLSMSDMKQLEEQRMDNSYSGVIFHMAVSLQPIRGRRHLAWGEFKLTTYARHSRRRESQYGL